MSFCLLAKLRPALGNFFGTVHMMATLIWVFPIFLAVFTIYGSLAISSSSSLVFGSDTPSATIVSGGMPYFNDQFGVGITFPEGWRGTPTLLANDTILYVRVTKQSGGMPELSASDLSSITLTASKNLGSLNNNQLEQNSLSENCKQVESSEESISGFSFALSTMTCATLSHKIYYMQHQNLILNLTYSGLPSAFDQHLRDFDQSAHTLIIK